ncbi:phasin family protein [Bradyrhizobium sp. ISRA443]|uniref:phasin family protein n=1 Tax=unclassified Bradyrhizobium TaxID=2631580 RepID=UPI00247922FB|nr:MULTISPECIES: phasin family protein [unclassified Bradyrhizobium]WGR93243.1 phasin family protein [Bradyrhizobium sp. ISRA435]WGR97767.1 phasin family protein [Bradyrhizobium sp. ISRA436]WGS04656.1 phasin family protein [Bradyrhizobium sp. ISRA437]WGS11537.1 phasin family protein [Bradyrhizobium sp. ISRA443]
MSESEPNGQHGFAMSLFTLPRATSPATTGELAAESIASAQDACRKIKAISQEMAATLRETYSRNARSVTDYGLKVIELSNANTTSAIDFFTHLLESKSVTDVLILSATEARRSFETTSALNRELLELAQKLAKDTAEPMRKSVTKALCQPS